MAADDSFVTPGSIPFRWEIRPGVPKIYHPELSPPFDQQEVDRYHNTSRPTSVPSTPQKLKPPTSWILLLQPAPSSGDPSLRNPICFARLFPHITIAKAKSTRKGIKKLLKPQFGYECGYSLDLETLARWSESSWKSSAFYDSPSSSSFSSYRSSFSSFHSSPRPACDAEWAGFGLF